MFEDILRAAQKANGAPIEEKTPPKSLPPKYDAPKKWYEKTWLIALLIFFVYPVGLIWLWAVGRYSRNVKIGVTVVVAFLVFIGQTSNNSADKEFPKSSNTYVVGYLRQGARWEDDSGRSHKNSKRVQVEIWDRYVVTGDGGKLQQFYFLEGSNAGSWGYTTSGSLSK